jgi:SAM-dependent methyltransferase
LTARSGTGNIGAMRARGANQGWESRAAQWLAWARTPGHDAYWHYRDAFFELLPPAGGRVLEVGCGEGRVTRDLQARGHVVTALDASPTLVAAAAERDPDGDYRVADAEALPFADAAFDLAVAYNVLMDVADMPRAVAEIGRVLAPGGCLCACVTHPVADAGQWEGGRFVLERDLLTGAEFGGLVDHHNGLTMVWEGYRIPLHAYVAALEAAGLAIEALREPQPARDAPAWYAPWRRVPMFLMWRARRAVEAPPVGGASVA